MKFPTLKGVMKRRILLNYRVDPERVASILPEPFRPKLHQGYAIAGICLIRLEAIRPRGLPAFLGIASENSAHRFAVSWEDEGREREGVFINQRHTSSRLNSFFGGRVFPGIHEQATFAVEDENGRIDLTVTTNAESPLIRIRGQEAPAMPEDSLFSLEEASLFFEKGSLGYSPIGRDASEVEGLRLDTEYWEVAPLSVEIVESAFFGNPDRFPSESIQFDHALLMRDVPHYWRCENTIP